MEFVAALIFVAICAVAIELNAIRKILADRRADELTRGD